MRHKHRARSRVRRPTSGDPRFHGRPSSPNAGIVPITFENVAELMIVALSRHRRARRHDVAALIRNCPTAPAS